VRSLAEPVVWQCGTRLWTIRARPLIMGILNVTPDSFSDGGLYATGEAAVARGLELMGEGADLVDVGGESTRPGAAPVTPAEESARVVPVIQRLVQAGVAVSVDTRHAAVAAEAVEAGACVINDVTGCSDPEMVRTVRCSGAGVVVMHMKGDPRTMQTLADYGNVVEEVACWLEARVGALTASGIRAEALAVDPGFGFAKNPAQNAALLAGLERIGRCGRPVLAGLSRKSWLGLVTGRPVRERGAASLAALCAAVWNGARIVRVHDVRESVDAAKVLAAVAEGTGI
jgi:dihydropteroate synthase